jgi:hypothetical protein
VATGRKFSSAFNRLPSRLMSRPGAGVITLVMIGKIRHMYFRANPSPKEARDARVCARHDHENRLKDPMSMETEKPGKRTRFEMPSPQALIADDRASRRALPVTAQISRQGYMGLHARSRSVRAQ